MTPDVKLAVAVGLVKLVLLVSYALNKLLHR